MSSVTEALQASDDPLEVELARTLLAWQRAKAGQGEKRTLGYEPRDIKDLGAVEVISRRVKNGSDGFDEVGAGDSYEAIVCKFPKRFASDVVDIAKRRMHTEIERYAPTVELDELGRQVYELRLRKTLGMPSGIKSPRVFLIQADLYPALRK
jgi:hypothetical protein